MRSIHPLDISQLSKMTGIEYMLSEVMEPNLFIIRKQKRDSAEKVTPMLAYYILDGSIYQAPELCNVFAARVGRDLYDISKAFTTAASKLEKIGYVDTENESETLEPKGGKEVKRVDHILASLQRMKNFCLLPFIDLNLHNPIGSIIQARGTDIFHFIDLLPTRLAFQLYVCIELILSSNPF
ncbi:hypothetical protein V6N12_051102 [Hibiscus sabdariffa]|uniref:Mediator of RNA polymerase II transcription subunit 6 n=1 Tax=Hibiscus sabdariffa TaxID=183260 RepID=A0ABR2GEH3_9ROSI